MLNAGFTTLLALKKRLLPSSLHYDTTWDDALMGLGKAAAARMNSHCNRTLERTEGQVDEFNAATTAIVLRAFPVETINSLEVRVFSGTLDDFTGGYQLDQRAGLMLFQSPPGDGTERIRIDYDGGFWLDDGQTMPAGATALPDDILEAHVMQCQAWAEARNLFGTVGLSEERKPSVSANALTDAVKAALEPYRRYSGE